MAGLRGGRRPRDWRRAAESPPPLRLASVLVVLLLARNAIAASVPIAEAGFALAEIVEHGRIVDRAVDAKPAVGGSRLLHDLAVEIEAGNIPCVLAEGAQALEVSRLRIGIGEAAADRAAGWIAGVPADAGIDVEGRGLAVVAGLDEHFVRPRVVAASSAFEFLNAGIGAQLPLCAVAGHIQ